MFGRRKRAREPRPQIGDMRIVVWQEPDWWAYRIETYENHGMSFDAWPEWGRANLIVTGEDEKAPGRQISMPTGANGYRCRADARNAAEEIVGRWEAHLARVKARADLAEESRRIYPV